MNTLIRHVIFLIILLCFFGKTLAQQNASLPMVTYQPTGESWTREVWTSSNRPYKEIRDQINAVVANKQDLSAVIEQSRVAARRNPYEPKSEYKYAYATYRAAIEGKPFNSNNLIPVRDALQAGLPPHVYDYTRLRFLVESTLFPNQSLVPVGRRLLNYDAEDTSVERNLIRVLTCSTSESNLKTAVAYAQELVRAKPENADYHGTLAGAYLDFWFKTRDQSYLKQAIKQYQEYLALAPAEAEYRKTAVRLLKTLQPMVDK